MIFTFSSNFFKRLFQASLFLIFCSAFLNFLPVSANYGDFETGLIGSLTTNPANFSQSSNSSNNSTTNSNNLKISLEDPYVCGSGTSGSVNGGNGKKIIKAELFDFSKLVYTVSTVADTDDKWQVDFDYSKIPSGKYTIISTVRDEKDLSASYQFTADVETKSECTSIVQLNNQINTVLIRTGGFIQNNLSISLMSAISLIGFVVFFKTFSKKSQLIVNF